MNSTNLRPKSAIKKLYSKENKNDKFLVKLESEEGCKIESPKMNKFNNQEIIEIFNKQKEKVNRIDLFNKKEGKLSSVIKENLEWKMLFLTRPKSSNSFSKKKENFSKDDDKNKNFVFPLALIDEKQDRLKNFITIRNGKSNGIKSRNKGKDKEGISSTNRNATRPQSIFSKRADNDIFYTNMSLNEYFTQDFKDFAHKFRVLSAKVPAKTQKTKKTIDSSRNKDKHLLSKSKLAELTEKNTGLNDKDINFLASSRNIIPFIKTLATTSDNENLKESLRYNDSKLYLKSNKPLGNQESKIDFHFNMRSENMIKLKELCNLQDKKKDKEMIISDLYDENDPDLKIVSSQNKFDNCAEAKLHVAVSCESLLIPSDKEKVLVKEKEIEHLDNIEIEVNEARLDDNNNNIILNKSEGKVTNELDIDDKKNLILNHPDTFSKSNELRKLISARNRPNSLFTYNQETKRPKTSKLNKNERNKEITRSVPLLVIPNFNFQTTVNPLSRNKDDKSTIQGKSLHSSLRKPNKMETLRPKTGKQKPNKSGLLEQALHIEKISTFPTTNLNSFIPNNTNDYFNNYIDSRFNSNFALGRLFNMSATRDNKPIKVNKNTSTSESNSNFNIIITDELEKEAKENKLESLIKINNLKHIKFEDSEKRKYQKPKSAIPTKKQK